MTETLEPCPFCPDGGKPFLQTLGNPHTKERGADVGCTGCGFTKHIRVIRYSCEWAEERAVEAWNTRAPVREISCPVKSDNWQPIEKAPKDGTSIYGQNWKTAQRGIVHMNIQGEWELVDGLTNLPMGKGFYPTHWQSLPEEPPAAYDIEGAK